MRPLLIALVLCPLLALPATLSAQSAPLAATKAAAKPGKAKKAPPRLSAEELSSVRSWARVLSVMERKSKIDATVESVVATVMACPDPTGPTGAPLSESDATSVQFATAFFAGMIETIEAAAPEAALAADRIATLPLSSTPLLRWRAVQVRSLREIATMAEVIEPTRDYCAFMSEVAKADPSADELSPAAYAALGLPPDALAKLQAMQTGAKQGSANQRAQDAAKKFLLDRGVRKLNIIG